MPEHQTQSQSQSQNESQSHSHGQSATASIADGVAWANQSSSGGLTDGEAAQLSSLLAASHANTDATSRHEGLTSAEAQQLDSLTALAYGTSGEAKSGDAPTENGTSFSGAVGFSTGGSGTGETDSRGDSHSSGISAGESAGIFSSEALQAGVAQRIGEAESLSAELAVATTYGTVAEALANMHSPSPELVSRLEGLANNHDSAVGDSATSSSGGSSSTAESSTSFAQGFSATLGGNSAEVNGSSVATSSGHGNSVTSTVSIGEARDSQFGDAVSTSGTSSIGSVSTDSSSSSRGDTMTHGEGSQNPAFSEGGSFTAALNAGNSDSHSVTEAHANQASPETQSDTVDAQHPDIDDPD